MSILERAGERLELMKRTRTVALIGMSDNPARASHFVATYLLGKTDWTLWFVNPRLGGRDVLGLPCYPSLHDVPGVPDLVDTFRRADQLGEVVDEAITVGASAVWFQLGLTNDDAAAKADAAGLDVVQNRCLKIEHARFCGGLHDAGFDTGVIDSRLQRMI